MAQAQTFSTYKILVGITPQGSISFLSDAWGGSTQDKYLTVYLAKVSGHHGGKKQNF